MAITFHNQDCDFRPAGRPNISVWIKDTIIAEGYRVGDIAYIFCSKAYHLDVNRKYLGHDYYTDVITFDYSDLIESKVISGDIFIDPETVREYAADWGTAPNEELMRVIIHGVMHLCGYGDKSDAEKKIMRSREEHYLKRYLNKFDSYPAFKL